MAHKDKNTDDQSKYVDAFKFDALQGHILRLERVMSDYRDLLEKAQVTLEKNNTTMDNMQKTIEQLSTGTHNTNGQGRRQVGTYNETENHDFDDVTSEAPRENRGRYDYVDRNIGSIKMRIPPFQGKVDPDVYLVI